MSYPSLRWPELWRVLSREPLNYTVERQSGSHKTLVSPKYPTLHLAFHDNAEIPPGLVRRILTRDVGLADEDARGLL